MSGEFSSSSVDPQPEPPQDDAGIMNDETEQLKPVRRKATGLAAAALISGFLLMCPAALCAGVPSSWNTGSLVYILPVIVLGGIGMIYGSVYLLGGYPSRKSTYNPGENLLIGAATAWLVYFIVSLVIPIILLEIYSTTTWYLYVIYQFAIAFVWGFVVGGLSGFILGNISKKKYAAIIAGGIAGLVGIALYPYFNSLL